MLALAFSQIAAALTQAPERRALTLPAGTDIAATLADSPSCGAPKRQYFQMMTSDDDPLAAFDLPPDLLGTTYEHAISDDADVTHERGHAVAAALQQALKGSTVEYGFPGTITAHMKSGAVAHCGGPGIGWMIDVERTPGARPVTIDVDVPDEVTDPVAVAEMLAKALRKY